LQCKHEEEVDKLKKAIIYLEKELKKKNMELQIKNLPELDNHDQHEPIICNTDIQLNWNSPN
jgi:hypothetical protein